MIDIGVLERVADEAWRRASDDLAVFRRDLSSESQTLAMQAASPEAKLRYVATEFAAEILRSLYASNILVATAVNEGVLTMEAAVALERQATEFVVAVMTRKRFFCPVSPCEWRGTLESVGPTGRCPTCGSAPLSPSPEAASGLVIP